ncbi:MAG: Ig-like domain repeat protein, partial [Terracidiphilus sp.]
GFGGGIANLGTLTVTGSTISGNSASTGQGSGIFNAGTLTVTNSTIAGNAASGGVGGGVMNASGTLTVTDSTISGNSAAGGGGIYGVGTTVNLANSIVSGNSADADIDGGFTDKGGNLVGVGGINLAPLGNYGGPAQTMIPLPGSPAICFINPSAATGTDQRGDPRTTTYNAITCQDSGAVQSNYSLTVSAEPPPSVFALTNFSTGVTLDESGNPFIVTATPLPTVTIPLSLNGTGVLTGGSAAIDDATGIATYSALQVSLVGTNDSLTANLTLNLAVTPTPLVISATGSQFDVELTPTTTTAAGATATYSAGAQNVTLSATVTSTSGTVNAGTVTFAVLQGATQIGASVTSGTVTSGAANASFVLPAGTAAGTYTIQATYGGTTTLATSSDNTHTLVVSLAITTTAAASATTPYNASAQSVTLTATVTSPSGPVNAGTVTFTVLQGATPVGTAVTSGTVLNGAASVSYALPAGTSAGTYTIQAAYSGTVSLSASSDNTHTLTVSSAGTTTATASAVATYNIAAQNVTLTATVTSPSGPVNAGTVTFTVLQGATPVGTVVTSGTVLNGAASVSYVLPAGTSAGTYTIQAAYSGTVSLSASSDNTHTLTVGKATATVTLGSLTQTYTGLPLSATATTTPSGLTVNFTYNGSPTSPTTVGSYTVIGTISDANYQGSATGTLEITQATPTISWAAPAAITYGTGLSATQLDASSTVAGTFAYNPGTGIVLTAGSHTLSVTFTPTDTTDYTTAMASVTIIVNQAAPAIVWPTPAAITYGTALSATQLDASSTVAGTFAYNPGTGTKLTAGPQTLSVIFTPTDTTDYTTATASVTITVNQAVPPIVWATPAAITYGTALSATQLDASSTVAGTFVYNPGTGTLLAAGSQTLSVTFTPTDTADYTTAMASVTLLVNDEPQTITLSASTLADAAGVTFGVTPLTLSATATSGLPVVFTLISGAATLSGNSLTINGAGTVIIAANQSGNSNYAAAPQVTESIPVNKALSAAAIASSVNPVLVQNGVTFTATVTSSVGTPTGTVTFLDGATPLGMGTLSGGVATFATSSLAAGSHSITAAYGGDANFLGATSSALTQQVEDFGFTISSQTVTVLPGGSAVFTFTVNPIDGTTFPAAIAFTASGLPAGATYTFSPASVTTGEGSTTVTLTIDVSQTQAGINPVNLHPNIQRAMNNAGDSAGSRGRPNPSVASGVAPFALALILLPFAGRLRRAGKRLGRTLSMLLLLVAGAAAIAGISGCGSTSGFFAQQQQSYTVTVTGTSGTLTHSASVTLKVE